ncbi:Zinc finger MYND domain-containing protein 10 [Nymphon striatum]|nr:Zinc finger MYND domain-containing protein 10 [Nymphon striatum]
MSMYMLQRRAVTPNPLSKSPQSDSSDSRHFMTSSMSAADSPFSFLSNAVLTLSSRDESKENTCADPSINLLANMEGEDFPTLQEGLLEYFDCFSCAHSSARRADNLQSIGDSSVPRRYLEDESKGALGDTAENEYKKELDVDELVRIEKKIKFDVFVKCLSIIRYIIQHMITVNLSVTARIISVHDIPVTLAKIIQLRPWIRKSTEKGQIYVEGQWKEMSQEDILIVSKIDGQVNPRNRVVHVAVGGIVIVIKKEDVPCELRSMLNTVIIQQLPVLEEFRRFLEQLSISEPAPTKPLLILEQVPVFYEGMLKKYSQKQWKEIAEHHIKTFLSASKEKILHQAKMLAEVYNPEDLEALISTMPKCAVCGEDAPKRCSRCKNEWYCRRYIFFYSADSAKWNIGQDTARRATSCNDVFCIRVSSMYGIVQIHEL